MNHWTGQKTCSFPPFCHVIQKKAGQTRPLKCTFNRLWKFQFLFYEKLRYNNFFNTTFSIQLFRYNFFQKCIPEKAFLSHILILHVSHAKSSDNGTAQLSLNFYSFFEILFLTFDVIGVYDSTGSWMT